MTRLRITEAQFQRTVTELAEVLGWRWVHFRPAKTDKGWRTPVEGSHAKGWPDLILCRERLVVVELKGSTGKLEDEQADWLDALRAAGVEAYCWKPDDMDEVEAVLRRVEGVGS